MTSQPKPYNQADVDTALAAADRILAYPRATSREDADKFFKENLPTLISELRTTQARIRETGYLLNLMEEAGEVVQIAAKYARFGRQSYHPDDPEKTPNDVLLAREIGNFQHCTGMLCLPAAEIEVGRASKHERIKRFGVIAE